MTTEVPASAPALPYGQLIPVRVHFDELDALGMLHNARYPLLAERAWLQLWQERGDWQTSGDASAVVKELRITYEEPVHRPGPYAVHLWLERLGTTSLTYGFRLCAADGGVTYAHGTRTVIRLAPGTLRPTSWSDQFRTVGHSLLRPAA
ncbi:acyl-CoA thioesterase [Streptomyces brasiliscabiei]|uniref:acyl-CoA thioesterase n=1 Tax=Streptomyces brasiliscabiei TaxID=2736302 RepID=UPI001C105A38|nr:acyl-CoA thioesterase [Streptomyces brasiliscabiei]